ncbi:MAG: hypothetical protein MJE68_11900 [Proteobacteria bacterium]|nr:hypothetical protein [Pseudomonadota bacterium]
MNVSLNEKRLNQKSHHKDHNEQFDIQNTMDILVILPRLNLLTQHATLVEHCAYTVKEVPGTGTFDEVYTGPHEKESEYQSLIDHDMGSLEELSERRTLTAVGSKHDHVSKKQEVAAVSSSETKYVA